MTSNYVVWTWAPTEHAFVLHKMSPVPKFFKVVEGEPRASDFPADVTHTVSADYPHDMVLDDVFESPRRVFLVSERLMTFLAERSLKNVEFLPVKILDHKQRVAGQYYVLHPVHPVDCLNDAASGAKPDPNDKDYVHAIDKIVLKPEAIDPTLQIFRIKRLFEQIIIRRDLAAEIDAEGFTGVSWTELVDFHRS